MYIGSDDGVYYLPTDSSSATPKQVLETGRVMRLTQFEAIRGIFAATQTGLYRRLDGGWKNLEVPQEQVYAVGATRAGRLFAGTRPAAVYTTASADDKTWEECDGLQQLPSRGEWRLPRHENLAQIRDVHVDPGHPSVSSRIVVGVEVGGIHCSEDGGETWFERHEGVANDIHELHVVGPGEYVAATGRGLYRSSDAGQSWTRLDTSIEQSYFRAVHEHDGVIYAGSAMANSSTWNEPEARPQLVDVHDESVERIAIPYADETVTGLGTIDDTLVAVTHSGHVLWSDGSEWTELATVPMSGDVTGRYTPVVGSSNATDVDPENGGQSGAEASSSG